jgi:hypothetical protein
MPIPAIKRQVSTPIAVFCAAMIAVAMEYQISEVTKMDRRPSRSAIDPNPTQPTNMPAKLQKTKKPMPSMAKSPAVVLAKRPLLTKPGAM